MERFTDSTAGQPPVSGFLHEGRIPGDALVLTHGAGGNANAPLLIALGLAFAEQGISVLRCDLPFRQRKTFGPPSPSFAKEDQAGLRRAAELLRERAQGRIFLGGQSYGGRQCSMLLAEDPSLAHALLLLSYPLHPPGKPDQLRVRHLPALKTPTLFVSGTKDPFGSIAELDAARKLIPARTELVAIESAGHSLLTKTNRETVVALVVKAFLALVR